MLQESDQERYKRLHSMRKAAKIVNYSSLYGVGAAKLAREMGSSKKDAENLLKAFWELNWSIKKVAGQQYVKKLKDGSTWVKNPVSGFYYSLRNERDIWSTINQGTGVYIFDNWMLRVRNKGVIVPFQYHDELLTLKKEDGSSEELESKLHEAMEEVNKSLKLNVNVKVDVQFGRNYAEVH